MEQFNFIHIISFTVLPAGLFFALVFLLKNKPDESRGKILFAICIFNIVLYIIYKIYQAFFYDGYDYVFVYNLPLHFCNLNLVLMPLAIKTRNKTLLAYQVYFGTFLSLFALVAIDPAFRGEPFFEFSCMVYYYYHSMLMVMPFAFLVFKMFTPTPREVWKPVVLLLLLTFIAHIYNTIFRVTGIASEANYFFTYGIKGDPYTEMFWSILPYEFLYLLPGLAVLFGPYITAIVLPYYLWARKRKVKSLGDEGISSGRENT